VSILKLKIEKLVYGGDGLARLPAPDNADSKGKTVFVPFVLEGEEVSARIVEEKSGFARARAEEILAPSPLRVEPRCPYFLRCGGCHYQHTSYEHQLEIKKNILYETLKRTAKIDWQQPIHVHASPPWNYRNRTRMKVRAAQASGFAMGYYRFGSHQLLSVEECPISSPLINRAIAAIWLLGKEGVVPAEIGEIEYFVNSEDTELLLEIYMASASTEADTKLQNFAEALKSALPEFIGAAAFVSPEPGKPASEKAVWTFGQTEIIYRTKMDSYHVRAGSFFQTNRFMTDEMVATVAHGRSGDSALDLYAGTGLFSLRIARSFKRVIAVESAPASFADLRANAPANVESVRSTTEEFLRKPQQQSKHPDYIVVDPPRAGLGEKVARSLVKMGPSAICYVSCDPSTLARDLRVLSESGYRIESLHLFDLFPQTFHIETIVQLVR
jgi:23S rRNA (uracil1939-C5)-methyltransferase